MCAQEATDDAAPAKKREYVYLLHADETRYNQNINADAQILVGNVAFRHDSLYMYCDSALFFEATNSLSAYGKVHMAQGDTLFLDGEQLFYDGDAMLAEIRYNVRMEDPSMVLTTDSLNYDRTLNLGYYFDGGTLRDSVNTLVSDWGEYDTSTKEAVFNYNVTLTNDNFTLTSDTLGYNTTTRIAVITGPSDIVSDRNHITTTLGRYYTNEDQAQLMNRSVLFNDDNRLVGDSLFYDHLTGYGEAFRNVVMDDFKDKCRLTGEYVYYNEVCDSAFATDRAIAIDYSQGDSLFIHADTLCMTTHLRFPPEPEPEPESESSTDKPSINEADETDDADATDKADATSASTAVPIDATEATSALDTAESIGTTAPLDAVPPLQSDTATVSAVSPADRPSLSTDSIATAPHPTDSLTIESPTVEAPTAESLPGNTIPAIPAPTDTDTDTAPVPADISADAIFLPTDMLSTVPTDSLFTLIPSLDAEAPLLTDTLVTDTVPPEPVDSTYRIIKGYHKVRMFRSDVQAVCDSLVFNTLDSCITMYVDPIIWNGHQQVLGETIMIYLNDSTIDWVHIKEQALLVEQLDTTHYNQISGREMKAYFNEGEIEHTDVEGNVLVVYYYVEEGDSVLIGMNTTQAGELTAFMKERQVDKLFIKGKSSGVFYPMTQIPPDKMRLATFGWFSHIRPLSPYDILIWRGKSSEQKLKKSNRSPVPLPSLKGIQP